MCKVCEYQSVRKSNKNSSEVLSRRQRDLDDLNRWCRTPHRYAIELARVDGVEAMIQQNGDITGTLAPRKAPRASPPRRRRGPELALPDRRALQ